MSKIVVRQFAGREISHREDGYMDATAMCAATGKRWSEYRRLVSTTKYLAHISEKVGIPIESLIQVVTGRRGGTYVYPTVAIHLAQWCSQAFAAQVSVWVDELVKTGKVELIPEAPKETTLRVVSAPGLSVSTTTTTTPAAEVVDDPILSQLGVLVGMRKSQLDLERRMTGVEDRLNQSLKKVSESLLILARLGDDAGAGPNWYSMRRWCETMGWGMDAKSIGIWDARLFGECVSRKVNPRKVRDAVSDSDVWAYPADLLQEIMSSAPPAAALSNSRDAG